MKAEPAQARLHRRICALLDGMATSVAGMAEIVREFGDEGAYDNAGLVLTEIVRLRLSMAPEIDLIDIVRSVGGIYRVSIADILSDRRDQPTAMARQAVMLVAHNRGMQSTDIARALNLDHTTVIHGIAAAKRRLAEFEAKGRA